MAGKYRIEQAGQFLGHWTAHTPQEAISKMLHSDYGKCYNIDDYGEFILTKNGKTEKFQF